MREHHFVRPAGGCLALTRDDYRGHLVAAGYSFGTIQRRSTQFAALSRWLESEGLTAGELNDAEGQRFASSRRAAGRATWVSPASVGLPMALRATGVVRSTSGSRVCSTSCSVSTALPGQRAGAADKTVGHTWIPPVSSASGWRIRRASWLVWALRT